VGQLWAVLYENGMSLTTASEETAQRLAQAEYRHGRLVTVRRLDDVEAHPRSAEKTQSVQAMEPVPAEEPASLPEPVSEASLAEFTLELQPARAPVSARRRRLLLYLLAAAVIIAAAALADHWDVLPRLGASTSTSTGPRQVSGRPRPPQLLPPLEQPPVMHFGTTARGG
jgi:ferric-dicitrate binding protein FerR (iron transport regulator)